MTAPLLEAPATHPTSNEATPSTVASDGDQYFPSLASVDCVRDDDSTTGSAGDAETEDTATEVEDAEGDAEDGADMTGQLGPGLYSDDDVREGSETRQLEPGSAAPGSTNNLEGSVSSEQEVQQPTGVNTAENNASHCAEEPEGPEAPPVPFSPSETLMIWDWDDTILPSSYLQRQGLRLDANSHLNAKHREILAEVATAAARTMSAARRHGTVVLVTNAERGWIELSCRKFLPTLCPLIEGVKIVSARTSYEGPQCSAPLQWKLRAFAVEIANHFGSDVLVDTSSRKNVFSFGDSLHEREALLVATSSLPNCRTKALKFVERPDSSQILKQHELIAGCFEQIVHHDGDLDLCIKCP